MANIERRTGGFAVLVGRRRGQGDQPGSGQERRRGGLVRIRPVVMLDRTVLLLGDLHRSQVEADGEGDGAAAEPGARIPRKIAFDQRSGRIGAQQDVVAAQRVVQAAVGAVAAGDRHRKDQGSCIRNAVIIVVKRTVGAFGHLEDAGDAGGAGVSGRVRVVGFQRRHGADHGHARRAVMEIHLQRIGIDRRTAQLYRADVEGLVAAGRNGVIGDLDPVDVARAEDPDRVGLDQVHHAGRGSADADLDCGIAGIDGAGSRGPEGHDRPGTVLHLDPLERDRRLVNAVHRVREELRVAGPALGRAVDEEGLYVDIDGVGGVAASLDEAELDLVDPGQEVPEGDRVRIIGVVIELQVIARGRAVDDVDPDRVAHLYRLLVLADADGRSVDLAVIGLRRAVGIAVDLVGRAGHEDLRAADFVALEGEPVIGPRRRGGEVGKGFARRDRDIGGRRHEFVRIGPGRLLHGQKVHEENVGGRPRGRVDDRDEGDIARGGHPDQDIVVRRIRCQRDRLVAVGGWVESQQRGGLGREQFASGIGPGQVVEPVRRADRIAQQRHVVRIAERCEIRRVEIAVDGSAHLRGQIGDGNLVLASVRIHSRRFVDPDRRRDHQYTFVSHVRSSPRLREGRELGSTLKSAGDRALRPGGRLFQSLKLQDCAIRLHARHDRAPAPTLHPDSFAVHPSHCPKYNLW